LLYSGEQTDALTGQQYLRARYYNPNTGQFNRLDDFFGNQQDPQSFHKYAYVHGDPVQNIDPTGLFSAVSVGVSVGIGAALVGAAAGAVRGAIIGYQEGGIGGAIFGGLLGGAIGAITGFIFGFAVGFAAFWAGVGLAAGGAYFFGLSITASSAVAGVLLSLNVIFALGAAYEAVFAEEVADQAAAVTALLFLAAGPRFLERVPFWPRGSWRNVQLRLNNFIGRVAENVMIIRYTRAGWVLVGRQISFRHNGKVARADAVMRNPNTGELLVLDSKFGQGPLRASQEAVYPEVANGNAEVFGGNAQRAGLTTADFAGGVRVRTETFGTWWAITQRVAFGSGGTTTTTNNPTGP
ncbi:MAG: RHS repeat-associated core domain-containing protein, partial [Planctomycetota bacterium]